MKLRQLIDKLEELSKNGKNDNMDVECWSSGDGDIIDGNEYSNSIIRVGINRYVSPNDEYDYIMIETE